MNHIFGLIIRVTQNVYPIGGDDELDTVASNVGASKWQPIDPMSPTHFQKKKRETGDWGPRVSALLFVSSA